MKQNVSERLNNINNCFQQVKLAIDNKLGPEGYLIIDEKYSPEAFGSRYATWSNNIDAVRLVWDGKDEWFYLYIAYNPPFDRIANWKELTYIPYLREHDLEYASSIPLKIVASLI